jgi:hypothetical protein
MLTRIMICLSDPDRKALGDVDPRCKLILPRFAKLPDTKKDHLDDKNDDKNNNNTENHHKIFIAPDPDTLLARLNTRRLCQRIIYYRKEMAKQQSTQQQEQPPSYEVYAKNKNTLELAIYEWKQLLEKTKQKNLKKKQETDKQRQQSDVDDNNNAGTTNETTTNIIIETPPAYELLLFSPCPRAVTVLASYPRSGNSLLRNLFEQVTLRVTGSDMRGGLTQHDLVGEAAVSNASCQFVKTHFPERPNAMAFPASRVVLLVRNPYDAILSYFHLMVTNTHTTSYDMSQNDIAKQRFIEMAQKEIVVWGRFHRYWLQQNIPILLVRYEDLVRNPEPTLGRIIRFVLEIDNMTFFQDRIQRVLTYKQTLDQAGAYKPRSGGIGKSLSQYPLALRHYFQNTVNELMHQLGYGEFVTSTSTDPNFYKVPPIPGYAFEIQKSQPSKPNTTASRLRNHHAKTHPQKQNIVMINKGGIVRNKQLWTDWRIIRKELGLTDQKGEDDLQNPYEMNEFFDNQKDENQKKERNIVDWEEQKKDEKKTELTNSGDALESNGSKSNDSETNTVMERLKLQDNGEAK